MENLSHRVPGLSLTPTSQSPANTIADHAAAAMTSPGSPSVNVLPTVTDNLVDTAADTAPRGRTVLIGEGGQHDAEVPVGPVIPDLDYEQGIVDHPPWKRL